MSIMACLSEQLANLSRRAKAAEDAADAARAETREELAARVEPSWLPASCMLGPP
jgi:hypothetical protein